nr:HAMP domain-containing sensor histidine kinase [Pontibacter ruber]
MSISLLGVVGLQWYWITDAIKVKQEQFDRSVHEALAKVVEKLETQEAVSVVTDQIATLSEPPALPELQPVTPYPEAGPAVAASIPETSYTSSPRQADQNNVRAQESGRAKQPTWPAQQAKARLGYRKDDLLIRLSPYDSIIIHNGGQQFSQTFWNTVTSQVDRASFHSFSSVTRFDTLWLSAQQQDALRYAERMQDSMLYLMRQQVMPMRFPIEELQLLAMHLDSLRRMSRPAVVLRPANLHVSAIRPDSVFFYDHRRAAQYRTEPMGNTPMQEMMLQNEPQERPVRKAKPVKKQQPAISAVAPEQAQQRPDKLEVKKEKLNDVVEKMVVEYVAKDVPLQKRLDLGNLKPLLQAELADKGICTDFGYWVVSGKSDTVASYDVVQAGLVPFSNYKVSLFPNDIFEKPDYLAVYFPNSQAYAIQSLWFMLLCSALFTLVIVATFGTTIHIIFKQKKLSDMKNDFINNMTHEFKTPIATISLATDSISNPKVYERPEKIRYYTNIIKEENKRMNAQVESVLQIALLEKNEFKMTLQPVDVHALALRAVESIRLQVEQRNGQITANLLATEHELQADEVHLFNVICNLLDNANKYSPASPDITLTTYSTETGLVLSVEDKGLGMSREAQQRVFEKFYRVPTGNVHNVKGFGLGLSYVKAIVQAHHGNIRLKSELGKGSRFEVFLPFAS